jgi:hypothetical protein
MRARFALSRISSGIDSGPARSSLALAAAELDAEAGHEAASSTE